MTTNEPPPGNEQPSMSSDLPSYGSTPPPPEGSYPPPPPTGPPTPMAGGEAFSPTDAFGYGWKKFQENLGPILLAALLLIGVGIVASLVGSALTGGFDGGSTAFDFSLGSAVVQVVSTVVEFIIGAIIVRGALDITEGKKFSLGAAYSQLDLPKVIITAVLVGILVAVGFMLCILPGIVAAFFTLFALYFVVDDKGIDPVGAIKASFELVKGRVGDTIVMMVLSLLAIIAGALACGVGLLVALPVIQIAWAYAYKKFQGEPVAA